MDSKGSQGVTLRSLPIGQSPAGQAAAQSGAASGGGHSVTGWVIAGLIIAAIIAAIVYVIVRPPAKTAGTDAQGRGGGAGREVPVVASKAKKGELPLYLYGLGTVTPFNLVAVRSRVGGQIVNVAFKEGQDVQQGNLLVEIDPRPFQVQLEQAEGQKGRDMALLNNAQEDLKRYESAGASVAQQQIDSAASLVRQYAATVQADEAGINSAKLQLTYCKITAPFTGRIGLRKVDVGNIIDANDTNGLAVIAQLRPIAVVFSISQDDAATVLRKSQGGIGLTVDAYDRGITNQLASGSISAMDNQIDPSTGTLKIKASFENKDGVLFPSQFVNARLLVDTMKDATIVPAAAIQHGPDGEFVYIVKKDQTVEVRPAKIGPTTDDLTAISEGVEPGETVVTDGVDKLQPGAKVAIREGGRRGATTRDSGHGAGRESERDPNRNTTTQPTNPAPRGRA